MYSPGALHHRYLILISVFTPGEMQLVWGEGGGSGGGGGGGCTTTFIITL